MEKIYQGLKGNLYEFSLHKYASKKSVEDFSTLKETLENITQDLYDVTITSKEKISKLFSLSLKNNLTIMVNGCSSTIAYCLIKARKAGKRFKVLVCSSLPSNSGKVMHELLSKNDIESKLITDASIAYYMKDVDYVLCGRTHGPPLQSYSSSGSISFRLDFPLKEGASLFPVALNEFISENDKVPYSI